MDIERKRAIDELRAELASLNQDQAKSNLEAFRDVWSQCASALDLPPSTPFVEVEVSDRLGKRDLCYYLCPVPSSYMDSLVVQAKLIQSQSSTQTRYQGRVVSSLISHRPSTTPAEAIHELSKYARETVIVRFSVRPATELAKIQSMRRTLQRKLGQFLPPTQKKIWLARINKREQQEARLHKSLGQHTTSNGTVPSRGQVLRHGFGPDVRIPTLNLASDET